MRAPSELYLARHHRLCKPSQPPLPKRSDSAVPRVPIEQGGRFLVIALSVVFLCLTVMRVYELYRCSLVHSWNLFEASIYPATRFKGFLGPRNLHDDSKVPARSQRREISTDI